jgi:hypothetical protein
VLTPDRNSRCGAWRYCSRPGCFHLPAPRPPPPDALILTLPPSLQASELAKATATNKDTVDPTVDALERSMCDRYKHVASVVRLLLKAQIEGGPAQALLRSCTAMFKQLEAVFRGALQARELGFRRGSLRRGFVFGFVLRCFGVCSAAAGPPAQWHRRWRTRPAAGSALRRIIVGCPPTFFCLPGCTPCSLPLFFFS